VVQIFAVKQQSKANVFREKMQKAVLNEMLVMELLEDCPNIMRLHDAFEDKHSIFFVMEYCKCVVRGRGLSLGDHSRLTIQKRPFLDMLTAGAATFLTAL
jgi:serine/threonine protein kinase